MTPELFGINFYDILPIITFTLVIGVVSVILFLCNRSTDDSSEDSSSNGHLHGMKKKSKKKVNALKQTKPIDSPEKDSDERRHETRHIEIKNSPEILDDEHNKHSVFHPLLAPGKPILRKSEEEILVNNHECLESVWTKVPRDEVEILRSRHSSVVSETRFESRDDEIRAESKLSRGQKKRLKAKLKTVETKQNENNYNSQSNNSAVFDFPEEIVKDSASLTIEDNVNKSSKVPSKHFPKHYKTASITSSDSSQISEKINTYSARENNEKMSLNDFVEDFQSDNLEEAMDNFTFQPFSDDFNESEDKINMDREIKQLKEERFGFLQKLNEFPSMAASVIALKAENERVVKKYDNLEITCNALKKELTSSIQINASTEGKFVRFKNERNQNIAYCENEISKLTNKVNLLEGDLRTKSGEQEAFKNAIDKLHQMNSDKDKHIQNINIEISSIKEQLFKKRMDCQDLEAQIKNVSLNLKEAENQKKIGYDEIQRLNSQIDMLMKEKTKEFEQFKRHAKAQEKQQDAIISSLQYQLDEFSKEKQQRLFSELESEGKASKSRERDKVNVSNTVSYKIPEGYQLIESSNIANFTSTINDANERLKEKCSDFDLMIAEHKDKEATLEEQNACLIDKYSKLNSEFESHLSEIVSLRQCIENLQRELSKNSETTIEEMKLELDEKSEALRKTEEMLVKLELSVDEDVKKMQESLMESRQDNLRLENDLKSQATLVSNQNKRIMELTTLLQTYNNSQNESLFNGSASMEFSQSLDQ